MLHVKFIQLKKENLNRVPIVSPDFSNMSTGGWRRPLVYIWRTGVE